MAKLLIKWFQVIMVASTFMVAVSGWSEESAVNDQTQRPGYGTALADVVLIRPVTFLATVLGSVLFVVTVPVTALTGTIGEAGHTLVVDPALTTFYRCLGCTEVGWRKLPKKDASDTSQ